MTTTTEPAPTRAIINNTDKLHSVEENEDGTATVTSWDDNGRRFRVRLGAGEGLTFPVPEGQREYFV